MALPELAKEVTELQAEWRCRNQRASPILVYDVALAEADTRAVVGLSARNREKLNSVGVSHASSTGRRDRDLALLPSGQSDFAHADKPEIEIGWNSHVDSFFFAPFGSFPRDEDFGSSVLMRLIGNSQFIITVRRSFE